MNAAFDEVVKLIENARFHASKAINTTLIDMYWEVGKYDVSHKIKSDAWGKSTVKGGKK